MKAFILLPLVALALLVTSTNLVYSQNRVEYPIQVDANGAAVWLITQTVVGDVVYDDLESFQYRVDALLLDVVNKTSRNMTATVDSITSSALGSYVLVEYEFLWIDFSRKEGSDIVIGDIFQVPDFFPKLYGDGEIYISYPQDYFIEAVSPLPSKHDELSRTLEWPGIADFNMSVNVVIRPSESPSGLMGVLEQNAILIGSLVISVFGVAGIIYLYKSNSRKLRKYALASQQNQPLMESEEEKVLRLLKSMGGSIYQSAITDNLKFSRAKTSQLLSALEGKGVVERYKKGRDKIVTLVDNGKRDQP